MGGLDLRPSSLRELDADLRTHRRKFNSRSHSFQTKWDLSRMSRCKYERGLCLRNVTGKTFGFRMRSCRETQLFNRTQTIFSVQAPVKERCVRWRKYGRANKRPSSSAAMCWLFVDTSKITWFSISNFLRLGAYFPIIWKCVTLRGILDRKMEWIFHPMLLLCKKFAIVVNKTFSRRRLIDKSPGKLLRSQVLRLVTFWSGDSLKTLVSRQTLTIFLVNLLFTSEHW